jgi:hypothetical protein
MEFQLRWIKGERHHFRWMQICCTLHPKERWKWIKLDSILELFIKKILEDPTEEMPPYVCARIVDPEMAPNCPTILTIDFECGDAVAIDGQKMTPATILTKLNELASENGVGRLDLVEGR